MKIEPLPVPAPVNNGNGATQQQQQIAASQEPGSGELYDIGDTAVSEDGSQKRRWIRKPLNKRVKRLKQNRRLRKLLIPKNALMSLHELMGSQISDYRVMPEERGFVAQVLVNNIQYEGRGECN